MAVTLKTLLAGFRDSRNACCGAGKFNARVLCLPFLKPCPNRDDYVFFDGFHPTQRLYRFVANETIAAAGL
jgi:phospholipase/lecithinase/hemolysin